MAMTPSLKASRRFLLLRPVVSLALFAVATSVLIPALAALVLRTTDGFIGSVQFVESDGIHIREIALGVAWPALGVLNLILFSALGGALLFLVRKRDLRAKTIALGIFAVLWTVALLALVIAHTRQQI